MVTNERYDKKQHRIERCSQPHTCAVAAACKHLGTVKNHYLRGKVILHFAALSIAGNRQQTIALNSEHRNTANEEQGRTQVQSTRDR